ncbi:MAG: acyl-CoA thioesterase [Treponema sp.]|nr:acyl-CoA thioesterase [Treponema sp.]
MKERQVNGPYNIYTETEITVEFYHCDPMNVVWHGNYIDFFETGRRALLEKIGYNYDDMRESGYAFPIIEVSAKYIGILQYRDKAVVKAILDEYENRLRIKFEIRNLKTGLITTKGQSTQMALDVNKKESCFVCPQILIDKIENIIKANKQ